jgi:hypothetical protein
MKFTDPSSKWRTHCERKKNLQKKNADYDEYRRIKYIRKVDGKGNREHLKITTCGPIDGVPTCLKFSSRKGFTCDS